MAHYLFTTQQGTAILFYLRRNARKNIIIRSSATGQLNLSIPPDLSQGKLLIWLRQHEQQIEALWQQLQLSLSCTSAVPQKVWFKGEEYRCSVSAVCQQLLWYKDRGFVLPLSWRDDDNALKAKLALWLYQQAQDDLLTCLKVWSHQLKLYPATISLTKARTFWGICRNQSGIRLNWRLIGAPDWVVDYVCIHELCHMVHPNHGQQFWQMVANYTPHVAAAKGWLRRYGRELFVI